MQDLLLYCTTDLLDINIGRLTFYSLLMWFAIWPRGSPCLIGVWFPMYMFAQDKLVYIRWSLGRLMLDGGFWLVCIKINIWLALITEKNLICTNQNRTVYLHNGNSRLNYWQTLQSNMLLVIVGVPRGVYVKNIMTLLCHTLEKTARY